MAGLARSINDRFWVSTEGWPMRHRLQAVLDGLGAKQPLSP